MLVIYTSMQINNTKSVQAFCPLPFNRAKVSADGLLHMCCHQSGEGYLGNLFERQFEDLWFGNLAENIRNETRAGRLHRACDTEQCPYRYQSKRTAPVTANARGYPTQLEFDLHGSHCNIGGVSPTADTACIMCPRSRPNFISHLQANPDRTDELIEKIKHLTPNLEVLNILGIAEPFWKDKIFEVMEKLNFSAYSDRICLWTTCNATIFNYKRQERLLSLAKSTQIHFSLDAATKETYMKIRRLDLFDAACFNIKYWCRHRETLENPTNHKTFLHNNINTLNVHEVTQMVHLAKKLGVDQLVLLPTHNCGSDDPAINDILVNHENMRIFEKAQLKAEAAAAEIGQDLHFSRPLALDLKRPLVQLKMI